MQISLSALNADPKTLAAWREFKDGFELHLRPADGDEQRDFFRKLGRAKGFSSDDLDANDAKVRDFWLDHADDWRGLEDGGTAVPFDRALLTALWRRDINFALWLVRQCEEALSFR